MAYQSINPLSGELLQTFDQHTDVQMESALAQADSTFQDVWSKTSFRDRAKVPGKSASLMLERKEQLARLAVIEMGKRISEGRDEVEMSAAILKYFAGHAEAFLAPQPIDTPMGDAHLEFSPLGVLIGVQPWNFPYYQLARFAASNLMAGNVLLVKHSSSVPQCALAFQQLFTDAGAPCGVYTNLFVSSEQWLRTSGLKAATSRAIGSIGTLLR
jgi:succinate-semialdehyde dehydrogenase/glutarate-semialdehyde dehydrogenase